MCIDRASFSSCRAPIGVLVLFIVCLFGCDDGTSWTLGTCNASPPDSIENSIDELGTPVVDETGTRCASEAPACAEWFHQIASPETDKLDGLATGADGAIYAVGHRTGRLDDAGDTDTVDGYVIRHSPEGEREWMQRIGPSRNTSATSVAVGSSGDIYVGGYTAGRLSDQSYEGGERDGFLARYRPSGERQWIRLLGTSGADDVWSVDVGNEGRIAIAGNAEGDLGNRSRRGNLDGFVATYDASGDRQWIRLVGTQDDDAASGIGVDDSGTVYVAGHTSGEIGDPDKTASLNKKGFVRAFSASGDRRWRDAILGFGSMVARELDIGPSGDVYVVGRAGDDIDDRPHEGYVDGFLIRYTPSGERRWVRHVGTSAADDALSIAVDSKGTIRMAGRSGGNPGSADYDGYVATFDTSGERTWLRRVETGAKDVASAVATHGPNHIYVGGHTEGGLGGRSHRGKADGFLLSLE